MAKITPAGGGGDGAKPGSSICGNPCKCPPQLCCFCCGFELRGSPVRIIGCLFTWVSLCTFTLLMLAYGIGVYAGTYALVRVGEQRECRHESDVHGMVASAGHMPGARSRAPRPAPSRRGHCGALLPSHHNNLCSYGRHHARMRATATYAHTHTHARCSPHLLAFTGPTSPPTLAPLARLARLAPLSALRLLFTLPPNRTSTGSQFFANPYDLCTFGDKSPSSYVTKWGNYASTVAGGTPSSAVPYEGNMLMSDGKFFDTTNYTTPEYNYSNVEFASVDGVTIRGTLSHGHPCAPVVIMVHGYGACRGTFRLNIPGSALWKAGFTVLQME
jgi:hypothetical protein